MGRDEAPYFYDFSSARHMNSPLTIFDFKVNKMSKTEKMFLAPEILNPELMLPLVGEKIDVFSLGVMLFITLFGRPPF
jgi:serine/threonine protein kinase